MSKKPKIVFFDIETAPMIVTSWTLYPDKLSHDNILKDWYIICGAWKTNSSSKVESVAITNRKSDYSVVKAIREALKDADIIVGHNLDKFDIKKLNARLIYHKLPPLPLIPTVDTLKEVKKVAAFTSNRLDYLAKLFTGEGKMHVEYNLWLDVISGSKTALAKMVKYCKLDVVRLEEVYNHMLPYMKTHPHVGALAGNDRGCSCPKCGSTHTKMNGVRVTASGLKKQEIQCLDCGSYHRTALKP